MIIGTLLAWMISGTVLVLSSYNWHILSTPVELPLYCTTFSTSISIIISLAHRLLQEILDIITVWSNSKGFRFSSKKKPTWLSSKKGVSFPALNPCFFKISKFHSVTQPNSLPCTLIKNLPGPITSKFLRRKTINILKIISHPSKGCSWKLLLQLYRSLIRSRLHYGAPIYNLASKSVFSLLDTTQTSSLRLALGAYRTSPRLSLCAEATESPFFTADWF